MAWLLVLVVHLSCICYPARGLSCGPAAHLCCCWIRCAPAAWSALLHGCCIALSTYGYQVWRWPLQECPLHAVWVAAVAAAVAVVAAAPAARALSPYRLLLLLLPPTSRSITLAALHSKETHLAADMPACSSSTSLSTDWQEGPMVAHTLVWL